MSNYTGTGVSSPAEIAAGPDGALWFTNTGNDSIGRITTSGTVSNYTGTGISTPEGIAAGPDGALWFTNAGNASIGRITTGGTVSNYTLIDFGFSGPYRIAAGPDGALWFTDAGRSSIGRISTSGTITRYTDTSISFPYGIAAASDGALWFINNGNDSIGRITTSGTVSNYTGTGISSPQGIAAGPDGALWFTNAGNASIGRITTGGTVSNYTGTGISTPDGIAVGPDGALWFTNYNNNSIGRITTGGTVSNYTGTGISGPAGIAAGPDGALWFTNFGNTNLGNSIGRIQAAAAPTGTIVVVKDAVPDDPQDFPFTAGGGLSPASFQLDDDGDDGNALSSTRTFSDVASGSGYSLAEAPQAGWGRSMTCDDGSPVSNITLSAGETVTCTFVNTKVATGSQPWGWGYNAYGQVGDGTTAFRPTPVQVSGLSGVIALSAGGDHSLGVKSDGSVWAWGSNGSGQLGDGTTTDRLTPVRVSGLSGVVAVAAGANHSLALKSDGSVWAWGYNVYGQLGDGTTISRTTPVQVNGLSGIVALGAGGDHSLGVKSDGSVWAWGYNLLGQLGDGTTTDRLTPVRVSGLSGVVAVAAGANHSLALKSDGSVWAWGSNGWGQLGVTGTDRPTPVQVSGLSGVVAVDADSVNSLALKSDGSVWAWGSNLYGQLGDGSTTSSRSMPVQVSGLSGAVAVSAGYYHSLALKSDGTLWAWGDNDTGQLGDGGSVSRSRPVRVLGLQGAAAVSAGGYSSLAVAAATLTPIGESTTASVGSGGTVTSDSEADGATPDDPVETSVTSPNAGSVSIAEAPSGSVSSGYGFLSQGVRITAPAASAGSPLVFVFRIDASQIPPGYTAATIAIFRNGTLVGACSGAAGVASPDPCVSARVTLGDGDAQLTVLTSSASLWDFGVAVPVADAGGPYTVPEGSTVQLDGSASQAPAGAGPLSYSWTPGASLDNPTIAKPIYTGLDDTVETLRLDVADQNGMGASATAFMTVTNVAPSVTISSPANGALFAVGSGPSLSASFTDPGTLDTHTCSIEWGDGATSSPVVSGHTCTQAHAYSATGFYTITVKVTDDDGGVGTKSVLIAVYNPSAQFALMGFHYHWSGDAGFPASKSYDGSHPASAKKNVAYSYRVHVLVSNSTAGSITDKLQGGLTAAKGASYSVVSATCGKAAVKTGKNDHVIVWNKSGDGNPASPGFTMTAGQLCQLEVQIDGLAFGSTGAQTITSNWTETQTGPGTFSGQSPSTGTLKVNVVA